MILPYLRDQSYLKVRRVIDDKMVSIAEFKKKLTNKLTYNHFFLITAHICIHPNKTSTYFVFMSNSKHKFYSSRMPA